LFGITKLGAKC